MDFNRELEEAKTELGINTESDKKDNLSLDMKEENFIKIFKVKDEEVEFDYGSLTGNKIIEAQKNLKRITRGEKTSFGLDEFDDRFLMLIAEMASGIPYKTLVNLKFNEYNEIKKYTRNFLLGISEEDMEEDI